MVQKEGKYPVYVEQNGNLLVHKALVSLDYAQLLEIANVFYYLNKTLASIPRVFGGVRLDEHTRIIHKSIHDAAVNCLLSLAEADRYEREGGKNG